MDRRTTLERRRAFLLWTLAILALVCIAAFVSIVMLLSERASKRTSGAGPSAATVTPSIAARCRTSKLADQEHLGKVAWVHGGSLELLDLGTCERRTLVASDAAPPVRFSADGRWLAFGKGSVVPTAGGKAHRPFETAAPTWAWSPTEDLLAGVSAGGGLDVVAPDGKPRALLPDGSRVGHVSFSPDGKRLAVDRSGVGVQVLHLRRAKPLTVLPVSDPSAVPEVAGWSPDGRWVLYFRGPIHEDGGPLDAVPATGGPWVNVEEPVLPYADSFATCGTGVAVSVGSGRELSLGKQIVLNGPPDWRYRYLTSDPSRSWFWPSCSPDDRWLAVTDSYSQEEPPNLTVPRGLWLIATDGSAARLILPGTSFAPEFPRWSSDGRVIMVIAREGHRYDSPGRLFLVQIDPRSGKVTKEVGPLAGVGSAPGTGGHQAWAEVTDWYRPGR